MTLELIEEKRLNETHWYVEKDGKYVSGSVRTNFEEALDFYNRLVDSDGNLQSKKVLLTTEID